MSATSKWPVRILLLDTGREWGGGTNSLIELLKRTNRERYHYLCVFYHNYTRGDASDVRSELTKIGIDFILLTPSPQPWWAKGLKELARVLLFFSRRAKNLALFGVDYLWRTRPSSQELSALARSQHIDLIYLNNQPSTNLAGIIAGIRMGIPVIQHARIEGTLNPIERQIANRGLTRMLCVSKGVLESFVRAGIYSDKCVVVHNGISADANPTLSNEEIRRRYDIRRSDLVIGTVGSLIRRKSVEHLLAAVARFHRADIKCLIVGGGPHHDYLVTQARAYGIAENCIFTGFQTDPLSYTNAMDIFVLASAAEGLPRVILEAMLLGKPVVASRVAGSSEVVVNAETGFLFAYGDVDEMTTQLQLLVLQDVLRKQFGQAGRQRVLENFSVEQYVAGVESEFDRIFV